MAVSTLRTCPTGHKYHKSSDCPTCPICANEQKPNAGFLSTLGNPARRALEAKGINSVEQLATYTEKEILQLHGMGPSSIPKLRAALAAIGLNFKTTSQQL